MKRLVVPALIGALALASFSIGAWMRDQEDARRHARELRCIELAGNWLAEERKCLFLPLPAKVQP